MQIAGKTVNHVENHLYVMDKTSLMLCEEDLVNAINEHNEVRLGTDDPELVAIFDDAFNEDVARATKALEDVQRMLVRFA